MSTYRKIHGRSIQAVTTDPTGDITEGQVWYNTTNDIFKSVLGVEAWRSGSVLSEGGRYNLTGVGTDTAGLVFGGDINPGPGEVRQAKTEEYNGLGWTQTPNMNTARDLTGGFGIQTAAATAGGRTAPSPSGSNITEHYDGSSWTTVPGTLNTTRFGAGGFGTQTAGAVCGGTPPTTNATEEYNGSAWTSVNNMNNSVSSLQSATSGTQTAGIRVAGYPNSNTIELYDGTNWTNSPGSLNTDRYSGSYQGSQTAGFYAGGELFPPTNATTATETWDGTSMTTSPATLGTAVKYHAGSRSSPSTSGWICGGFPPGAGVSRTEEYNRSVNVITAAAWASASNFPAPASAVRGFGTVHSASISIGGETGAGPTVNSCYSYDGSGWTSVPAIPSTARNAFGYGTQTAGLYSGGNTQPGQNPVTNASAEWDGSGWTSGPTMDTARGFGASSGVQTSALATGGDNGSAPLGVSNVESYNGSSWTAETAYPTGAYGVTGCGRSETTAFVFGGEAPYPGGNPNVATYNGSAWTTTATPVGTLLPANTQQASSYGEQDDCIAFGGTSSQSATAGWNGTAWSTRPSMGTGRSAGGTGISTDALAFCGSPVPAGGNKTEEFIGETSALNVKTLTQS